MEDNEREKQFEEHIIQHERLLHKICRMYAYTEADHQDLFQDIVLQLWQAYPKFRGDAKFSTWLYRVAINTAITGRRMKKDFVTTCDPSDLPAHGNDDSRHIEKEEQLAQLQQAIQRVNEIEKAIVMLYMEDRSYEEMEEVLGINSGTLRVKMNRIKEKLRQLTKTTLHGNG